MMDSFALARSAHGFVAVLAVAALWHPALARVPNLRNAMPASVLTVLTFGAGVLIYPSYRSGVKRELMREAWMLAQAFEVKEHIGFCVMVLAAGGAALLWNGERALARTCYRAAASLGTVVAIIGWWVSGWS